MYVKIIPLTKLARGLDSFDYAVPEKLKEKIAIGQLVEIPLRNKQSNGILISIHKELPNIKLKEILRIADNKPFLNKVQIELINWTCFYYCASTATLLKNTIPEIPVKKKSYDFFKNIRSKDPKILKSAISSFVRIIEEIKKSDNILLQWSDYKNKIAVYLKLLENLSEEKQVILIFPQLNNINEFIEFLPEKLRGKTSILNSEIPKSGYWQNWNKIRNSTNGLIIGTKQALFSPVKNLGLIIIDEEHNQSHKQWDQNPRYHSLKIALKLQELTKAKIVLSSQTPSVETFFHGKKNYKIITEVTDKNFKGGDVKIIKMRDEWKKGNPLIFSEESINELKSGIKNKSLSLIYINRRGSGTFAICKDCGHIPQCPKCLISLSLHKDIAQNTAKEIFLLKCHHCGYTEKLQIPCVKCHSFNVLMKGTGTEKIETELKKIMPEIKIGRIDLDNKKPENKFIFNNIENLNVLSGTKALLSYNIPRNINFILFLNIDTDLQTANFRALEETRQTIANFKSLLSPRGKIILQTYSEMNYLADNYSDFYEKELTQRKNLNYPPFSQLIKLTYKNKDSKIVKFETDKIYGILNENFEKDKEITLFGQIPLPMQFKNYAAQIVIKNTGEKDKLQNWFIKNIPPEWIIDVDPIEI